MTWGRPFTAGVPWQRSEERHRNQTLNSVKNQDRTGTGLIPASQAAEVLCQKDLASSF